MYDKLTIPSPVPGTDTLTFDMTEANYAEKRAQDIAIVNPSTAPELASVLSKGCFSLVRHISDCRFQLHLADKERKKRRAILIIDVIPEAIKEKKLGQNAETREAFIDLDEEYAKLNDKYAAIEAVYTLLKGQLDTLVDAGSAVRKLCSDNQSVYSQTNHNLATAGLNEERTNGTLPYGKARY